MTLKWRTFSGLLFQVFDTKKVEFWLKPKFFLGGDAGYILSKKDDDDDLGSSHTYL